MKCNCFFMNFRRFLVVTTGALQLQVKQGYKLSSAAALKPMTAVCVAQGHSDGGRRVFIQLPHPGFHCKSGRFRL